MWLKYERVSRPIFIIGPPRTGSSLLVRALQHCKFKGYSEGHIVPLMSLLIQETENYYRSLRSAKFGRDIALEHLPYETVKSRVVDIYEEFMVQSLGTACWFDKTVNLETIKAAPLLMEVWPHAKFIFTYRSAEESINSALKQFPGIDVISACVHWASSLAAWKAVRPSLGAQQFELELGSLTREGGVEKIEALAEFLDLDSSKKEAFCEFYAESFRDWSASGTKHDYTLLQRKEFDEFDRVFFSICKTMMVEYGFWDASVVQTLTERGISGIAFEYTGSLIDVERTNLDTEDSFSAIPGGFLLHPPAGKGPASVRYRNVELVNVERFRAGIALENPRAVSATFFRVCIVASETKEMVIEHSQVLEPGSKAEINLDLPLWAQGKQVDVVFSTECVNVDNKNYYCWAYWYAPRLE